jgi:tetratricopeptide (TPR) repeat protein
LFYPKLARPARPDELRSLASRVENLFNTMRSLQQRRAAILLTALWAGHVASGSAQGDARQAAFALERQGKTAEASSAWLQLSREQPSNAEPYAHLGLLEARQQHFTDAIGYYCKALALAPAMPGLRLNLGLAYFKNGDYKRAVEMFEPAHKQKPEDQQLNILLGMSYYGLSQFSAATPYLKEASQADPKNLTLLLTLAHSCLWSRQFPCVLDAFHQIVALNAESAEADMLMGEALDEMKDPVGAQREFRAAVQANPKEPNVHFGLGYLLWTKGQYPEAASQFQAELENNPEHEQAALYLADARMQMNQLDEARGLLERLVKLTPPAAMAHRDLGVVYSEQGRNEEAVREFQAAIRVSPRDVNAHYRLGRLYRTMGRNAESKAELEKASSLNKAEDDRLLKVMSAIPGGKDASARPTEGPTTR